MGDFFAAALSFPAALFSAALVVVVAYWALVLGGVIDLDSDSGDGGTGEGGGWLERLSLSGTPLTVVGSLVIAVGWFVSLAGTALLNGMEPSTPVRLLLGLVVLLVALVLGVLAASALVRPLRRLFAAGPETSRTRFVGHECVIRTREVTADFGQAEVTAVDGSSAVVQVRQTGSDTFTAGSRAVIYDYDADGEFFWVVPVDAATHREKREH